MSVHPTPLWKPRTTRRFPRPRLPKMRLDSHDRQALRTVGVYTVSAILACVAITGLIVVIAFWIRLFLALV